MNCYVLVFRVPRCGGYGFDWDKPTGGLVMEPAKILDCNGQRIAVADWTLARELAHERYKPAPWEELVIAEVLEKPQQQLAARLHLTWELEMRSFLKLMEVGT